MVSIRLNFKTLSIITSLALYILLMVSAVPVYSQTENEEGHSNHHYLNTVELFTGMTYEDGDHGSEKASYTHHPERQSRGKHQRKDDPDGPAQCLLTFPS